MVVYFVRWERDSSLVKGKGRAKKDDTYFSFTVLCRCCSDALVCLDYLFRTKFNPSQDLCIEDGKISMNRVTLDSRCFHVQYILMDGIQQPISLANLKDSVFKLQNRY